MKNCFLYPGQGAQYPGMGKELYEEDEEVRSLFELASELTKRDLKKMIFEGDENELKETKNTQIVISLMNLSLLRYLRGRGIESAGAAGVSLGEWSAYVDAGVLDEHDLFPLVLKRAELMSEAADAHPKLSEGSAMAAVLGMEAEKIEQLVEEIDAAYPANYNSPVQTVISGSKAGVERAAAALKEAGAKRVIPLKVSGPFHTPLLKKASSLFAELLEEIEFRKPKKPLFSNVTGGIITDAGEIRRNASLQIISPVRWTDEMRAVHEAAYERCIECGPGKVLSGLWTKMHFDVPCISADDPSQRELLWN